MGRVRIVEYRQASLPGPARSAVHHLHAEAWPPGPDAARPDGEQLHDPSLDPVLLLLLDGAEVIGCLTVLHRMLRHDGQEFRAAGLSAVTVATASRGRGHGRRLVVAGRRHMAGSGVDVGLFTCDRPLQPFYESCGWENLPGTVIVGGTADAPFRSDRPGFDKATMARFFTVHAREHRDAFVHADVLLYPGAIDTLW